MVYFGASDFRPIICGMDHEEERKKEYETKLQQFDTGDKPDTSHIYQVVQRGP